MPLQQILHALLNGPNVKLPKPHCPCVLFSGIFQIHGHLVDQSFFHKTDQPLRKTAVRIQFDQVPHIPDLFQKLIQIRTDERLSPADTDTV